jgi:hypothetical protein
VNLRKDHSHISVIDSRIELVTRFLVFLCSIRGVPVFHDFNSWSRLSACFEWWSRGMGPTLLCVTFLSAFNMSVIVLSAMDVLVPNSMKDAANCDKQCELQKSVNHQTSERIWHCRDLFPQCVWLSVFISQKHE